MHKTNQYWRATNPLVFISSLLLMGMMIAHHFSNPFNASLSKVAYTVLFDCVLLIEIFILFLVNRLTPQSIARGICIVLCIISWGAILHWSIQNAIRWETPTCFNDCILKCKNAMIQKINSCILPKEANSFSLALLIGIKMNMEKSILNAYLQLGIIHIIAISGMHLDILFKLFTKITNQFPPNKFFKILELILLLMGVWIYTFIASASPSIVRASLLFSIYLIGKFFQLSQFTFNAIAAGILLFLLGNIQGIESIGLQLSFAAVIGIHLFYKILYAALSIKNPIIQFLWSNCCVSLAAQITTLPILFLHFHKVASWVLVSNFVMVPLSNLILYGLIIVLILPQGLAIYFGNIVSKYILFFNQMVQNWFTHTKSGNILVSMTSMQVLGYYILLLLVYLWIYQRNSKYLLLFIGGITMYSLLKLFS